MKYLASWISLIKRMGWMFVAISSLTTTSIALAGKVMTESGLDDSQKFKVIPLNQDNGNIGRDVQTAGINTGFSMLIASDPQVPWWRGAKDPNCNSEECVLKKSIETNLDMVSALNQVLDINIWPTNITSLTQGAGTPIANPKGVIINGDLTAKWDPEQIEQYLNIYSGLHYQLYPGLGNHDYGNNAGDLTCYYGLAGGNYKDSYRCAKESTWWMAKQIRNNIPNLNNVDTPGFVRILNQAGYTTRYKITYDLNGQSISEQPPPSTSGIWVSIGIPSAATNIKVSIEKLSFPWPFERWDLVKTLAYSKPDLICLKAYGTLSGAVVDPTECVNNFVHSRDQFIAVYNEGGYVARFKISYYDKSGKQQNHDSKEFPAGAWETFTIPSGATKISLTLEEQTALVGFGWVEVGRHHDPISASRCYKMWGTTTDPKSGEIPCPGDWPSGSSGSLSYSFDIEDYHFVQLQLSPSYEKDLPEASLFSYSPSFKITPSHDWLKKDLDAATRAGKKIVINMHKYAQESYTTDIRSDTDFLNAIKDQNVVAIFAGHIHENYGEVDTLGPKNKNPWGMEIPIILSGSIECRRFLLVEFHPRYFNVGVVDSTGGNPKLITANNDQCDTRNIQVTDSKGNKVTWNYVNQNPKTAPRTYVFNRPPSVSIQPSYTNNLSEGARFYFDATGTTDPDGDRLIYTWNFGDGTTSYGQSTSHTFNDDGNFTVTVTADDGIAKSTTAVTVKVINTAPNVSTWWLSPTSSVEGERADAFKVYFSDLGTNDTFKCEINFGDGTDPVSMQVFIQSTDQWGSPDYWGCVSPKHLYQDSGSFTIQMTVNDLDGGSTTVSTSHEVSNVAPTAILSSNSPTDEGSPSTISFTDAKDPSQIDKDALRYAFDCKGGSLATASYANSGLLDTADCTFADNGDYVVSGKIMDKDNGATDYTTMVKVNNVAPTAILSSNSPTDEGSPATIRFTDAEDLSQADEGARFRYAFDCNGGSLATASYANSGLLDTADCTFADNGDYVVSGKIMDKDNGATNYSTTVTVSNVPPTAHPTVAGNPSEGLAVKLNGGFEDPGADQHTFEWKLVSSSNGQEIPGTTDQNLAFTPIDNGVYTFEFEVTDDDGDKSGVERLAVTVDNVAPIITANSTTINENDVATIRGKIEDPGGLDSFTLEVNWGEAEVESVTLPSGTTEYTLSHPYLDDNPSGSPSDDYTVHLSLIDKDGGKGIATPTVTVQNLNPDAKIKAFEDEAGRVLGWYDVIPVNTALTVIENYSDVGLSDTLTAVRNWGDGFVVDLGTVEDTTSGSHTYTKIGYYEIILTVTDDDGGIYTVKRIIDVVPPEGAVRNTVEGYISSNGTNSRAAAELQNALEALDGEHGAIIKIERGNPYGSMLSIEQAMHNLKSAQNKDQQIDLSAPQIQLALTAQSLLIQAISQAEIKAKNQNQLNKIAEARVFLEDGKHLIASGDYLHAVVLFRRGLNRVR